MSELMPMPEIERASEGDDPVDEAEMAAAAFLARPVTRDARSTPTATTCGRSSSRRPMSASTS